VLLTRRTLVEGTEALLRADPALGRWIETVGSVGLRRQRHQFGALCRAIISQQLGAGAARTIHRRFLELFAPSNSPDPGRLLAVEPSRLAACGISGRKVEYLRSLAREFHAGSLRRARLGAMRDAEVVELLTRLPGIGVWTVEMFLIFSLGRLDIFSVRDLALRTGVERVLGRKLSEEQIEAAARRWSPYRSVASLYLWKIAHWKADAGIPPPA
jgi:DNA-3-methyladenine glycosylase II